jgi:MerR family transcriptional regulator, heat shock protein HspR
MSTPRFRPEGQPGPEAPVYVISVAAELTGLHPQTLRSYDRIGLVRPGRTGGGGRRYSWRDIELLREVAELTATGIGLEGVRRILDLEHETEALRRRVAELERDLAAAHQALRSTAEGQARSASTTAAPNTAQAPAPGRANLPVVRPSARQSVTVWRRTLR